jgi:hypothetical protein
MSSAAEEEEEGEEEAEENGLFKAKGARFIQRTCPSTLSMNLEKGKGFFKACFE